MQHTLPNCPVKDKIPASAYISCLCAKNSDQVLFAITNLVTGQACSAPEASSAASVFTNLCAKANVQLGSGSASESE